MFDLIPKGFTNFKSSLLGGFHFRFHRWLGRFSTEQCGMTCPLRGFPLHNGTARSAIVNGKTPSVVQIQLKTKDRTPTWFRNLYYIIYIYIYIIYIYIIYIICRPKLLVTRVLLNVCASLLCQEWASKLIQHPRLAYPSRPFPADAPLETWVWRGPRVDQILYKLPLKSTQGPGLAYLFTLHLFGSGILSSW